MQRHQSIKTNLNMNMMVYTIPVALFNFKVLNIAIINVQYIIYCFTIYCTVLYIIYMYLHAKNKELSKHEYC